MAGTLLVGDVHGCAAELDLLLRRVAPTRVVLVGDLFTRGPDPRGVWDLIRAWNAEAVLGNHDHAVLEAWKGGRDLPKKALRWLAERPHVLEGPSWIAVHAALHPRGPAFTRSAVAAGLTRLEGGEWYRRWRGPKLVIHGHEAKRIPQDRRPWTLGLDTACVRGGALTGYIAEEGRLVSVPAIRDWT
jgi:hypothetical protein